MSKIRLMIIDDHEVVRKGLSNRLEAEPYYEVVAESSNGFDALELVSTTSPDVVIADLQLPRISGIETIRNISKENHRIRIIAYTFYDDEATILSAFHAGAMGYVLKSSPMEELLRAITEVMAGHRYLGSPLPELAIDALINMRTVAPRDTYALLTSREKEVLQLVAEGNTNAQIADKLFISRRTVEIHRSHMMKKLGLHRPQVDLVQYAAQRGLIKSLHTITEE